MTHYKNILVACELLEDSLALPKAEMIAKASGAKLHLIHVVEQFYTYGMPPYPANIAEMQDELIEAAKIKLRKIAKRLDIPEERCYTPVGSAKEEILEVAKSMKADLIVLGSHSERGLSYFFLGSTANAVLHGSTCDVLAVRAKREAN